MCEQNQQFMELRQKVGIYIQKLMLLRGVLSLDLDEESLDGKHNIF